MGEMNGRRKDYLCSSLSSSAVTLPLPVTPAHVTLNLLNSSDVLYVLLPVSAV